MSSGETDSIRNTTIHPVYTTPYWPTTTSSTSTVYLGNTVYYYQVICPNCETLNWAEVDKIFTCKGKKCGATIKAVLQSVDYEIEVIKP